MHKAEAVGVAAGDRQPPAGTVDRVVSIEVWEQHRHARAAGPTMDGRRLQSGRMAEGMRVSTALENSE
jgi:hypothetical protein